jgi:hypothetical protein
MKELVFLVEGEAERNLLDVLMPRLLPEGMGYRVIPFQGKQDMEKRMNLRIRAYQNAKARFIVLRDQDSHTNCVALKQSLGSRAIGRYLDLDNTRSPSFKNFVAGVRRLSAELLTL